MKHRTGVFFLLSIFLFLFVVALVTCVYYLKYLWTTPLNVHGSHVLIRIDKGDSFKDILEKLRHQGVVKDTRLLYVMGKLTGAAKKIKSGEFLINTRWSQEELLKQLVRGRPFLHKVRILEGSTWWEVGDVLAQEEILKLSHFEEIIFDRDFLRKNNIPGPSAEGYLYPDTYYFERGDDFEHAKNVVERLIDEFWKNVKTYVWKDKLPPMDEIYRVVILASMVEKEALYDYEKPIIAGVFLNRLKKNMRLQCDPTVIYGLGRDFDGNLKRIHLRDKNNRYNTYVYKGLPPTPICSPSIKSILAVVHPVKHSYLYFVAKGDGTHKFSSSLKEHNSAVYRYQINPSRKHNEN